MVDRNEADVISSARTNDLEVVSADERQQARAFLRERFLRVVTGVVGKRAEFHLHENTRVSGEFRGCDVAFSKVFVKNLETPIGQVPAATLRGSDIIHLKIDDIDIEQ